MRTPAFWLPGRGGPLKALLSPAGWLYGLGTAVRGRLAPSAWKAPVPVICIGNVTAGGAGKTPVARDVARRLRARGLEVHFLSRGYGGDARGPLRVDRAEHTFRDVGDEPLLLAADGPTWIAADRAAGARAAVDGGAQAIVMDDGFQNPSLTKDGALLVIDGGFGLGNGGLIPAGPLREPLAQAVARAHGVALIGADGTGVAARLGGALPVFRAHMVSQGTGQAPGKVVAFAGIGRPEKFFDTATEAGYALAETIPFADHHPYTAADMEALRAAAERHGAGLLTTEKDLVRLDGDARVGVEALTITLRWEDETALDTLLDTFVT